jgi:O-antigen/teichoic acid export membrane protein
VIFGSEFVAAAAPLNVLAVHFALIVITLLCASFMVAYGHVGNGYWIAPLACLINLPLNFMLIPQLGMVGAALAAVASQATMLVALNLLFIRHVGNPYGWQAWSRILLACAMLWGCLQITEPMGAVASAALSLVVYGVLVAWLGLFPPWIVREVFANRFKRRLGPTG